MVMKRSFRPRIFQGNYRSSALIDISTDNMSTTNDLYRRIYDVLLKYQILVSFTCLALLLVIALGDFRSMRRRNITENAIENCPLDCPSTKVIARCVEQASIPPGAKAVKAVVVSMEERMSQLDR